MTALDSGPEPSTDVDVSVIIPTFNGERYLGEVLDAIAAQRFEGVIETLVIDSGSTDATLELVRSRPHVRLHQIQNSEFGHGRTRNLGAQLARGRTIVFLTQDATPAASDWIAELIAPLALPRVRAVVGRQIPRRHAFPLQKYDIERTFAAQGPIDRPTIVELGSGTGTSLEDLSFYSDVNSATDRAFLLQEIPLRDVHYSEDVAFARDVLEAGYRKAYAPGGAVVHSNDMGIREYARRLFDETLGLRRASEQPPAPRRLGAVLRAIKGAMHDTARIVRDPDYGLAERAKWIVVNPLYHFARWDGIYHGARVALDDERGIARRSWEARRRRELS